MITTQQNNSALEHDKTFGPPTVVRITSSQESRTWKDNTHMHDGEVELHLVKQGETTITIHNQTFLVKTGDIVAINPGLIHLVVSDAPVYIYTCRLLQSPGVPLIIRPDICPVTSSGEYYSLILKIMEALVEVSQRGIAQHSEICNMLGGALGTLFHQLFAASDIPFALPKQTLALNVLNYINDNYNKNLTLSHLSQEFFISSSHISNEFKREFNISPINYLINRRICEAKWYLINTRDPINEIAKQVGYENSYHFSKIFVKRAGISPEKFKELHRII